MTFQRDKALRERASHVIPGGMYGHLDAKYYTEDYPQFYARGVGAHLWDVDGNRYIDYMCGFGTNLLGYVEPRVEAAARRQFELGDCLSGPTELMVTLAEKLTGMIKHADWALFCKNGSDATAIAVMCARAHKNKRKILLAKGTYHGAQAWNTPVLEGVLPEDRAHIVYYDYNDVQSLTDAVNSVNGDVAAIFATPFRHEVMYDQFFPSLEYAQACRSLCDDQDALLVVDEVRTGLRLSRDCSWSDMGVDPDLSTWGKAIANGHPISAVLGSEKAKAAAEKIFVTGSYWFAAVPMAAAIETLEIVTTTNYLETMNINSETLRTGIAQQAARWGFELKQTGPAGMPQMLFAEDDEHFRLGRLWTGELMKRGSFFSFYHNMFISASHTAADIQETLGHTDEAFAVLNKMV